MDIEDLVADAATGARFRMSLAWAVLTGVIGIVVYAEMASRVAAISRRSVFDLVRERLAHVSPSRTCRRRSSSTS